MSINRNTYEIYLVDYYEGNLDALQVSELLLFLEQNPDLKAECENLEFVYLAQDNIAPLDKGSLKKPDVDATKERNEHLLIAQLEGDLTKGELDELTRAKALYPELNTAEKLFALTKLTPDLSVQYPRKRNLKRFVLMAYYPALMRIAAVLILFSTIGLYFWRPFHSTVAVSELPAKKTIAPNRTPSLSQEAVAEHHPKTMAKQPKLTVSKRLNRAIVAQKHHAEAIYQAPKIVTQPVALPQRWVIPPVVANNNYHLPVVTSPTFKPAIANIETNSPPQSEFISIGEWIKHKVNKALKTENVVAGINKSGANVYFSRDTVSGKITRFEIAGIGFERNH
ncbi:MAG: hypothetical protein EAY81_08450 [Bacteroidetes bacterium]|nr:MAG: hypothetical protein EAY81_08450 [Bacteroidota bacterium]